MDRLLAGWRRLGLADNGWAAAGLLVLPALVIAALVAPSILLAGRLPAPGAGSPYWPLGRVAELWCWWWAAVWLGLLLLFALTAREERRWLWEVALPVVYAFGGFLVGLFAVAVGLNLDAPARVSPGDWGWPTGVVTVAAALVCGAAGVLIGRRAFADEADPLRARGRVRAVWLATTWAGPVHWLWSALAGGVVGAFMLTQFSVDDAAVIGGAAALVVLSFGVARVSITPAGLRVRVGPFGLVSLRCTIRDIAAVDVIRLPRFSLVPSLTWGDVRFRSGPALRLLTRFGTTRVVAMRRAAEAAEVLERWRTRTDP